MSKIGQQKSLFMLEPETIKICDSCVLKNYFDKQELFHAARNQIVMQLKTKCDYEETWENVALFKSILYLSQLCNHSRKFGIFLQSNFDVLKILVVFLCRFFTIKDENVFYLNTPLLQVIITNIWKCFSVVEKEWLLPILVNSKRVRDYSGHFAWLIALHYEPWRRKFHGMYDQTNFGKGTMVNQFHLSYYVNKGRKCWNTKCTNRIGNTCLRKCQSCQIANYCNKKCQKKDWKFGNHKFVCYKFRHTQKQLPKW